MKVEKNPEIEFIIPNSIKEFFIEGLKVDKAFENIKFKKSIRKKGKKSDDVILILQTPKELSLESVQLGAMLNELKVNSSAKAHLKNIEKKSQEQEIEPIKLRFERSIEKQFRELFSESLNIKEIHSVENGKFIDVYFDVSDISGRSALVKRIAQIFDALQTIKAGRKSEQDLKDIQKAIQTLEQHCNYLQQTHVRLEKMSGAELIAQGYASPFLSKNQKQLSLFNQFFRLIKGKQAKQNIQYYFFEKIVELDSDYVVKLSTPRKLSEPVPVNHAREILLNYQFGEQLFTGRGIIEVESYFETIVKIHNERIEAEQGEFEEGSL
jgi:hypothetical protein